MLARWHEAGLSQGFRLQFIQKGRPTAGQSGRDGRGARELGHSLGCGGLSISRSSALIGEAFKLLHTGPKLTMCEPMGNVSQRCQGSVVGLRRPLPARGEGRGGAASQTHDKHSH